MVNGGALTIARMSVSHWPVFAALLTLCVGGAGHAHAGRPLVLGGKLPLTRGATGIEGAAGAGLATWAIVAGNETEDGIGATAFATRIPLPDYGFTAYGGAVGLFDRVELSYARQDFDTSDTGARLGLGRGFTFGQDIVGAKVRVAGDAVYEQDRWLPQVAVGVQYKSADHADLITALGGDHATGVDFYVAATKIWLAQSLIVNATLRYTEANQFGLLGFGGDKQGGPTPQIETSMAYMVSDRVLIGAEHRTRPNNLRFARERDAYDAFAAYAVTDHVTLVAGYADLGPVATFENQGGAYLSVQIGF